MSPDNPKTPNALLHGALDGLILKTLTRGPKHGYAIARFIEETTGDAFLIEDGSLYPALYRVERRGWVEAEWGTSELGRRASIRRRRSGRNNVSLFAGRVVPRNSRRSSGVSCREARPSCADRNALSRGHAAGLHRLNTTASRVLLLPRLAA